MFDEGTAAAAYIGLTIALGYLEAALPFVVLGAGVWMLIVTRGVQVRALKRALVSLRSRSSQDREDDARAGLSALLAASVGMGSVAAAALALATGGPGAIGWMWIAAFLGMGLAWAEVTVSSRLRDRERARTSPGPVAALRIALGRFGGALAFLYALALLAASLAVGVLLQVEQSGQFLRVTTSLRPEITAGVLAVLLAALALAPRTLVRRLLARVTRPLVIGFFAVYTLAAVIVLGGDLPATGAALRDIVSAAFGELTTGGLTAGGLVVLLQIATVRVTLASEAGLGTHGYNAASAPTDASRPALMAMLVPALSTGVIGTLTALVLMVSGASHHERVAERLFLPLTSLERQDIRPSEFGQSFTLPSTTLLRSGNRYPMEMQAHPRGHKVGKIAADERTVGLPAWRITEGVDTVYLRYKDARGKVEAFDVEIPCERVVSDFAGVPWLDLKPLDPDLNLRTIMRARELEGPYLRLGDASFEGVVLPSVRAAEADSAAAQKATLFEAPRDEQDGFNPSLRTLVVLGYAGPYVDDEQGPEPPWALLGVEGFAAAPGTRARLRLMAPARGLELGYLNPRGNLSMPPWDFLAAADKVVLRHREDPARDITVPVRGNVEKGRLEFISLVEGFKLKDLTSMKDYEPRPFLVAPPYRFAVDVHTGIRLPPALRERRTLVPLESYRTPRATPAEDALYRPNPREVIDGTEMFGPFLDQDGAGVVASGFARALPTPLLWLLALSTMAMVVTTLHAWTGHGASAVAAVLADHRWLRLATALAFVVVVAVGASVPLQWTLRLVDASLGVTLLLHVIGLVLLTPHIYRAARDLT